MNVRQVVKGLIPALAQRQYYRNHRMSYIRSINQTIDSTKPTVIVLNHFFDQDCRALEAAATDCNLVVLDAPLLVKGSYLYFENRIIELAAPYESSKPEDRARWRSECERIWSEIVKRWNPTWIVASNDNFYWIRELIPVAQSHGCKVAILDKEGTISPHSWHFEAERARKFAPCISDLVCVWSKRQAEFWQRIGMPSERIRVVGQPRSDLWYAELTNEVDSYFDKVQPLVTFFSYDDNAYIPLELYISEQFTWHQMKTETHELIARLAHSHPDINFVIKTHPQQTDRVELAQRYNLRNLKVISGSSCANELIRRSLCIVAFQTTAVIEAMALGRPTIYTNWDEHIPMLQDEILPLADAPGITTARSVNECAAAIECAIQTDTLSLIPDETTTRARQAFVDQYFYNPDGHASKRFFTALREHDQLFRGRE